MHHSYNFKVTALSIFPFWVDTSLNPQSCGGQFANFTCLIVVSPLQQETRPAIQIHA